MTDKESNSANSEPHLPVSESSILERFDQQLRDGVVPETDVPPQVETSTAETLIQLNRTFDCVTSAPPTFIDRFEVRRQLGQGQFGTVYLAWDPKLKREVAIKVAGQRTLDNHDLRQRFQREAELAARLNHPGLVRVFEVGDVDGTPFYVMPVADGVTLRTWLNERTDPVPLNDAIQIVIDIANAMQHGHDLGIIHRDLKPANVMIRPASDGETGQWKICVLDFGLAAMADPMLRETEGPMLLGTPMYMSPEQAEGRRDEVGTASDQFTLGNLLYELLTGRAAFQADQLPEMAELFKTCSPTPPSQLRTECRPELDAICRKCLQRDPADRYASMTDIVNDLRAYVKGEPLQATKSESAIRKLERSLQRPGRLGQVGQILFVLTLMGGVTALATMSSLRNVNGPSVIPSLLVAVILITGLLYLDWCMLRERIRPWQLTIRYFVGLLTTAASCEGLLTLTQFDFGPAGFERMQYALFSFVIACGQLLLLTAALYASRFVSISAARVAAGVMTAMAVAAAVGMANAKHSPEPNLPRRKATSIQTVPAVPRTDRQIAELVISLGGTVEVVADDENFEVDSQDELPAEPLRVVWIMMLENENVTDELVERFTVLTHLEGIDLYHTSVTDRAAMSLARIESLEEVSLHETELSDPGAIALLTKPGIREVYFARTKVTDAALHACKNHPTLTQVSFDGTNVSDAGLRSLSTASNLVYVKVGDTAMTDEGFAELAKLRDIHEVNIAGTEVTSKSLDIIMGWPKLRHIYCQERLFDDMGIDEFRRQRPGVKLRTR